MKTIEQTDLTISSPSIETPSADPLSDPVVEPLLKLAINTAHGKTNSQYFEETTSVIDLLETANQLASSAKSLQKTALET